MDAQENQTDESMPKGLLGGALAAFAGAVLWATVTALTHFQIGWMAVGVGALVGLGVRFFGHGTDFRFGFAGAALALLGCLFGNLLAYASLGAHGAGVPLPAVLMGMLFEPKLVADFMVDGFGPMDFLFYALALGTGYKCSFSNVAAEY